MFENIDLAFKNLLNERWNVTIENASRRVGAMVVAPEEQFKKASYPIPSIGIYQYNVVHMPEREWNKIYIETNLTATTKDRYVAPSKYDFYYQFTVMSYFAQHDRYLVKELMKLLPPRGYITARDIDTQDEVKLWCFLEDFQSSDEQGEFRTFKKVISYKILGWLDYDSMETKKIASAGVQIIAGIADPVTDTLIAIE